jgi:hypothetical protein
MSDKGEEKAEEKAPGKDEAKPSEKPLDPKLDDAERAFEVGDYVLVRKLCDEVIAKGPGPAAEAARALRRRTEVDPIQAGVIAACLVLFLVIAYIYVL